VDGRKKADHGYHPHHGGRYDANEDRSPSLPLSGPQAFARHILRASMNVFKYSEESNPGLWFEDYQLAYQADDADDDYFIIRNLPLFLVDSA
jgi:hypothetical protein